jgi:potassium channel subfamily K
VQIRDVRALRGDDANMLAIWRGEEGQNEHDEQHNNEARGGEEDMLTRVKRYRNTFAEILVLGSILQRLDGAQLEEFERFRGKDLDGDGVPDLEVRDADGEEGEEEAKKVKERYKQGRGPERHEGKGLDDLEANYKGVTGRVFKRQAKKLTEAMG